MAVVEAVVAADLVLAAAGHFVASYYGVDSAVDCDASSGVAADVAAVADKLNIHPELDTETEMVVHNQLPGEEGHCNYSRREKNNEVDVEEEDVVASSYSSLASYYEKIVDVEKSLVILNYQLLTAGILSDSL